MIDIKRAMSDPASAFDRPADVVASNELSEEQKVEVLRRWRYDALQKEVAKEENMAGPARTHLEEIVRALGELGYETGEDTPPTKGGGV